MSPVDQIVPAFVYRSLRGLPRWLSFLCSNPCRNQLAAAAACLSLALTPRVTAAEETTVSVYSRGMFRSFISEERTKVGRTKERNASSTFLHLSYHYTRPKDSSHIMFLPQRSFIESIEKARRRMRCVLLQYLKSTTSPTQISCEQWAE